VLFIPGSAGSKAQARSIASEAYRQHARNMPSTNPDFAFYTVHTNEELSALDAQLISTQSEFVSRCMAYIFQQHHLPVAIIIGHSMGAPYAHTTAFSLSTGIIQSTDIMSHSLTMVCPHRWRGSESSCCTGYIALATGDCSSVTFLCPPNDEFAICASS
jgi:hypothetical protein